MLETTIVIGGNNRDGTRAWGKREKESVAAHTFAAVASREQREQESQFNFGSTRASDRVALSQKKKREKKEGGRSLSHRWRITRSRRALFARNKCYSAQPMPVTKLPVAPGSIYIYIQSSSFFSCFFFIFGACANQVSLVCVRSARCAQPRIFRSRVSETATYIKDDSQYRYLISQFVKIKTMTNYDAR